MAGDLCALALGEQLAETLQRYVNVYNHHMPQRALGYVCPVEALEQWRVKQPELFVSEINNLPGLDRFGIPDPDARFAGII